MYFCVDLDGTLSDVGHREHLISGPKKDWKRFQAGLMKDKAVPNACALVRALSKYLTVVYVTGRSESCREETVEWLKLHDLPHGRVFMRGDGDFRSAAVLKKSVVQFEIGVPKISLALDDDLIVRAMYEGLGITTIPVLRNGRRPT